MGLEETRSFIVICEHCQGILESMGYSIFPDDTTAMEAAQEEEWVQNEDGDYYCNECAKVDEKTGEITLDEKRRNIHEVEFETEK